MSLKDLEGPQFISAQNRKWINLPSYPSSGEERTGNQEEYFAVGGAIDSRSRNMPRGLHNLTE
jgi:hypothetical protein